MFETIVIFTVAMIPPVVSVWVMRQAQAEANFRLQRAIETSTIARWVPIEPPSNQPPEMGELIGDRSCRFNAHSPYIRCAVNPQGPCEGCRDYQSIDFGFNFKV